MKANSLLKSAKTILAQPEKYHAFQLIKLGNYNIENTEYTLTILLYLAFDGLSIIVHKIVTLD